MEQKHLKDQLESADAKISALELDLKKTERDLEYYRRVARRLTDTVQELGLRVWVGELDAPQEYRIAVEQAKSRIEKGKHMEVFQASNDANPMVNDAWKKYMMALRLCGFDEVEKPDDE